MTLTKSGKTIEIEISNFECAKPHKILRVSRIEICYAASGMNYGFLWKSVGLLNNNYTPWTGLLCQWRAICSHFTFKRNHNNASNRKKCGSVPVDKLLLHCLLIFPDQNSPKLIGYAMKTFSLQCDICISRGSTMRQYCTKRWVQCGKNFNIDT